MSAENKTSFSLKDTGNVQVGKAFSLKDTGITNNQAVISKEQPGIIVIKGKLQNYVCDTTKRLGMGKQAQVYKCVGEDSGKEYVIKIYNLEMIDTDKWTDTLELLSENKHKNVCDIVDYGECIIDGELCYYSVMEIYLKLENKAFQWKNKYNDSEKRQESEEYYKLILTFIEQMNEALEFIHKLKIYHCDIKPDNIMVKKNSGEIVLIDFGGATKAENIGGTAIAAALTTVYAAPESIIDLENVRVNEYTDYYVFGTVLAEFINGVYPKTRSKIVAKHGSVKKINNEYYVPDLLPGCFVNLLKGLCYKNNEDYEDMKANRWTTKEVSKWLIQMKNKDYEKAATFNMVPDNISDAHNATGNGSDDAEVDDFGVDETGKVRFVRFKLGNNGEKKQLFKFTNLNEMCDTFAKYWQDGKNELLSGTAFDKGSIKGATLNLIVAGRNSMLNSDSAKGESVNARYFEFLYENMTDKKTFYWGDLPKVHNIVALGKALDIAVKDAYARQGEFGDWTVEEPQMDELRNEFGDELADIAEELGNGERIELKTKIFAEILSNNVISTYLEAAEINNEKLKKQCRRVEKIFSNKYKNENSDRSRCTYEEIIQISILARMLKNDNEFILLSKNKYSSYDAFKKDIEAMAIDEERIFEIDEIMAALKDGDKWNPDFMAWRMLQGV